MADGSSEQVDGHIVKMEVDYSAPVDQRLPKLQEVIETLLSLEKQTHTASDMVSTSCILVAVVKMCNEAKEWDLLNENTMLLSKRRSHACTYVEEITDLPIKLRECARLTKTLATIKEQNGDVKEAASILQELQVETYRLCKAVKDYIHTQIISKKINTKFFQEENTDKLNEKWQQALKSVVLYVILASFDNEQSDLVHRISGDKELEEIPKGIPGWRSEIPKYKDLLKLFTTMELMHWSTLVEDCGMELRKWSLESPATDVFESWNIIMAKYYTSITMKRMTIFAKVDRLAGIINFQRPKDPSNLLNDWSQKLNSLMSLVNKTTHLIAKEEMIYNLQ
ncbi:unnamed protein product [Nyctereutes procyonoides]|uniref:(raccoon dog) hypothetical protein n=1 Tax=Nyctereutes procyonoides TaxID=34880 RepID=A0A811YBZ9_NYCPR|nr:unnamed protein product [Nyctereutes procyonoides]